MAPTRKLTGAQAILFANICEHYIEAAEEKCNDTPNYVPIFSWLSPQQRLALVREVMVGVLCEREPLPPNTIQHNAAYRAMIEVLFIELECELEMRWDDCGDVGKDLLLEFVDDEDHRRYTPEEAEERKFNMDLMQYRAFRNMDKMERKKVGDFKVEDTERTADELQRMSDGITKTLFEGGPISQEERNSIRPLNEDEKCAFRWRRLMDAALQEDVNTPFFALCNVNFDWRCQKKEKWHAAINLLLDTRVIQYGSPTDRGLVLGCINANTYADREQLPRIRRVEQHVEILRKVYESQWDSAMLSYDQRCIYAVCSNEKYCGYAHRKWLIGFLTECQKQGVEFSKTGNYQTRLDVFHKLDILHNMSDDDYKEGLKIPFLCSRPDLAPRALERWQPSKFVPQGMFEGIHCYGPGTKGPEFSTFGRCFERKNLKACSLCKVAVYCSAECQHLHWPKHKAICATLAAERKDKRKIAEMAKSLPNVSFNL